MINQVTIYHNPLIVRTAKTASGRFWQETGKTGNKPPENLPETRWLCFWGRFRKRNLKYVKALVAVVAL